MSGSRNMVRAALAVVWCAVLVGAVWENGSAGNEDRDPASEQTAVCGPNPDGPYCLGLCYAGNVYCTPRVMRFELDGRVHPIDCICVDSFDLSPPCDVLYYDPDSHSLACFGATTSCPGGQTCRMISVGNLDGSVDFHCECSDSTPPCAPTPDRSACEGGGSPDNACVPFRIRARPDGGYEVVECKADYLSLCRAAADLTGSGQVRCEGVCYTDTCVETHVPRPDGSLDTACPCAVAPPPTVACCVPDAEAPFSLCADLTRTQCLGIGAAPQGRDTRCAPAAEACRLPDSECMMVNPHCCEDLGGQSLGPGSTCTGDSNGDGQVNELDFAAFRACHPALRRPVEPDCCWADLNEDGYVDCTDWNMLRMLWTDGVPPDYARCRIADTINLTP